MQRNIPFKFNTLYSLMFLRLRSLPVKLVPSLFHSQSYFQFGDNKQPFDREIRSSPMSRKPSSFWDIKPKTPKAAEPKEQPIPVKEEAKEHITHSTATKAREGSPVDSRVQVPGTPLEQQPPKIEKEFKPQFAPEPLNFQPLSPKNVAQTVKSDVLNMEPQLNNQLNQDEEVNKVVMSNIGLNRYLTRLYRTSGAALMLTLASSYACIVFPELQAYSEFLILGGGALSFLSFKRAQEIRPKFFEEKLKDDTINRTSNGPVRLAIFSIGCISMGLSASPFFAAVQDVSSTIVPMTMGVTAAIFGGASLVGLLLPRSTMLGYGGVLGGSFFGLISLNATGVLAAKYLGITVFANTLTTAESYMGIGIFTLMIIYDTHMAIKRYQRGDADHLGMSIQLLLDIWNLIMKIIQHLEKSRHSKQDEPKSGSSNENNKKQ